MRKHTHDLVVVGNDAVGQPSGCTLAPADRPQPVPPIGKVVGVAGDGLGRGLKTQAQPDAERWIDHGPEATLATDSGKVRMVTPSRFALGQRFKLRDDTPTVEWFNSRIQNRLGTCLIDSQPLTFEEPVVKLRHGSCSNPLPSRVTWSGLSGRLTGTPSIPGYQLVNSQTAYYALDFCLFVCPEFADLASAEFVGSDPREFSGAAKWQFRFAVSAA